MENLEKREQALFTFPGDGRGAATPPFRASRRSMVSEYYIARFRALAQQRERRLAALASAAAAEKYRDAVRRRIRRAFGPPPPRRHRLKAVVTGVLERPGYRVEKLYYESAPGILVTANLYLPAAADAPCPGVIGTCGHSAPGKAAARYQEFCQRLVHAGFAVLIFDPLNQGERDQFVHLPESAPVRQACTAAHEMLGRHMQTNGDFIGNWFAWEGQYALDYLCGRPEVDPRRIGVTGNSGGGTQTTWLWALESRFSMAAPGCFVKTFLASLENGQSADGEQNPPEVTGLGLEMSDFFIARAPEPVIFLGQRYDYMDRRGLEQTFAETRRIYRLLGAEDKAALFIGPRTHGYFAENQRAMVDFFCRQAGQPRPAGEPPLRLEEEAALQATATGNVITAGGRPLFALTLEKAEALTAARRQPDAAALREAISRALALPDRPAPPHYRIDRYPVSNGEATITRYPVETEPGIQAVLRKRHLDPEPSHVLEVEPEIVLFLPHLSAEMEMTGQPFPARAADRQPLYALDVRGLGESLPDTTGDFFSFKGIEQLMDYSAAMLGESYFGRRLHDVLAVMDLLASLGARRIDICGRGQGGLLALPAGVLHPASGMVRVRETPVSWLELARRPFSPWPRSCRPRGVLAAFDLPDCARVLGERLERA